MSRSARIVVVALAVFLLAGAAVASVREVALMADSHLVWKLPSWWYDLPRETGWRSAVAGGIALAVAILCFVLLARGGGKGRTQARDVRLGDPGSQIVVRRGALEALVRRAVARHVPEVRDVQVRLAGARGGFSVRIGGGVTPVDLAELHARAFGVVRDELHTATGLALTRLDIAVDAFSQETGGD
jgi:hypothetical protein